MYLRDNKVDWTQMDRTNLVYIMPNSSIDYTHESLEILRILATCGKTNLEKFKPDAKDIYEYVFGRNAYYPDLFEPMQLVKTAYFVSKSMIYAAYSKSYLTYYNQIRLDNINLITYIQHIGQIFDTAFIPLYKACVYVDPHSDITMKVKESIYLLRDLVRNVLEDAVKYRYNLEYPEYIKKCLFIDPEIDQFTTNDLVFAVNKVIGDMQSAIYLAEAIPFTADQYFKFLTQFENKCIDTYLNDSLRPYSSRSIVACAARCGIFAPILLKIFSSINHRRFYDGIRDGFKSLKQGKQTSSLLRNRDQFQDPRFVGIENISSNMDAAIPSAFGLISDIRKELDRQSAYDTTCFFGSFDDSF